MATTSKPPVSADDYQTRLAEAGFTPTVVSIATNAATQKGSPGSLHLIDSWVREGGRVISADVVYDTALKQYDCVAVDVTKGMREGSLPHAYRLSLDQITQMASPEIAPDTVVSPQAAASSVPFVRKLNLNFN